ncbi:MAG: DNA repair protein RecO [Lachnospiraceae bacterium]|nr:DNA repair protein RecO [Lachnospiraceae bacterium]
MQECVDVTGIVIKTVPIGEYDKRVVILTKERGKIAAFARGARKPNSRFLASTTPFAFGTFSIYEGKTSYNINEISISNYFESLRTDFEGAYYGMYFLELCDYCTRENNDEVGILKLLYQSLRALSAASIDRRLVRAVFELRLIAENGEFPGIPEKGISDTAGYAVSFIVQTPVEKLYTFALKDEYLFEVINLAKRYRKEFLPGNFQSLQILESL